MQSVEQEFEIVLPKRDNSGQPIAPEVLEAYVRRVAEHFGGATVYADVVGCWDDGSHLQCEPNIVVTAVRPDRDFTPQIGQEDRQFMSELAHRAGVELGQEAIMERTAQGTHTFFVQGRKLASLPSNLLAHENVFARALSE